MCRAFGDSSLYKKRLFLQRSYLGYTSRDVHRWHLASQWPDFESCSRTTIVKDRSPDWPSAITFDLLEESYFGDQYTLEHNILIFIRYSAIGVLDSRS